MICVSHRGPDRRLVAEHRADHLGVAARVGLEVVLDLGHVALEARAQREQAGHLLGEELRGVGLGSVDPRGAAHDDRPHRGRLLERREQLEGADHVHVVHRPAGESPDRAGARSGCAPPCPPRAAGSASRSAGCGCRRRSPRCARARASAPGCRGRPRISTDGSRSRRAASSAPRWLPTPVISTRRPAISRCVWRAACACAPACAWLAGLRRAGSRSSIASSRRPIARSSALSSRMSS